MDPGPAPGRLSRDDGFSSLQFVVAAGLAMLTVVGLVQVIAYQYTRGAIAVALQRGVRVGAVAGAGADECRVAVSDSLAEVLGGVVGESVGVECVADPVTVRAVASGSLPMWVWPGLDLAIEVEAVARRESVP